MDNATEFKEVTKSNKLPAMYVLGTKRTVFTLKITEDKILECEKIVVRDVVKYNATVVEGIVQQKLANAEVIYMRVKNVYKAQQSLNKKYMKVAALLPE